MKLTRFRAALLGAIGSLGFSADVASAQDCGPGGCGPRIGGCTGGGCIGDGIGLFRRDRFSLFPRRTPNEPACATRTFPLSDWAYIRRFCGPSIIPGSCYGHFQTKWRRWEDVCPNTGAIAAPCEGMIPGAIHQGMPGAVQYPAAGQYPPAVQYPPAGVPVPTPAALPPMVAPPPTLVLPTPPSVPLPLPKPAPGIPGGGTSQSQPSPRTSPVDVPELPIIPY